MNEKIRDSQQLSGPFAVIHWRDQVNRKRKKKKKYDDGISYSNRSIHITTTLYISSIFVLLSSDIINIFSISIAISSINIIVPPFCSLVFSALGCNWYFLYLRIFLLYVVMLLIGIDSVYGYWYNVYY